VDLHRIGGQLVIHDFMLDDDRSGPLGAAQWFYTYLPTTSDAVSFSGADVIALAEAAGFVDVSVEVQIPGLTSLLIARKASA
jgi:2-hydroxy-4-(methylsulfanyl)butanoate S-methyltransferase